MKTARETAPEGAKGAKAPVKLVSDGQAAPEGVKAVLAEIIKVQAGRDLADRMSNGKKSVASVVAAGMNGSAFPCPTGGRIHPARPGFTYWTGIDLVAFVAKHSGG